MKVRVQKKAALLWFAIAGLSVIAWMAFVMLSVWKGSV
jgi:hypothetical protein